MLIPMSRSRWLLPALLLAAATASALCPHEVLVLANDTSIDSVLVAKTFLRLRGIPESNFVRLSLPENLGSLSPADFTRLVWEPANAAIHERGLERQILAWVYSTDIPYRISTSPEISITGLTFLRNQLPDDLKSALGAPVNGKYEKDPRLTLYASKMFAGPNEEQPDAVPQSRTFEQLHAKLLQDMPLPAMLLGWTGERGNTVDEVIACLRHGRASDGIRPKGTFTIATNTNVRSVVREWEHPAILKELRTLGMNATVSGDFPSSGKICGLISGTTDPPASALEFQPGAYADHFTSFGGAFHIERQTKISEWIRRGATATSGTVCEPQAFWQKFPSSALFVHQARGCCTIEAIYQSVRSPLQLLPIGDPLARPWGVVPKVQIAPLPASPLSGQIELGATTDRPDDFKRFEWLVDGRRVGSGAHFLLDTRDLSNGQHRLRAVARTNGPVRHNGYTEISLTVEN